MILFCTYCGKSFTRKEHLERHIPSHTNVKPHRCGYCQLSFSRRDLLQRHHSTYHEVRDSSLSLSDPTPTLAGRTPIACMNCANAKTGCDKTVPCSRCAEKNLPCAARFARRASKLLRRAATTQWQIQGQSQQVVDSTRKVQVVPPDSLSPMNLGKAHGGSGVRSQSCGSSLESDTLYQQSRPSNVLKAGMNDNFLDTSNFSTYTAGFHNEGLQYAECLPWNNFLVEPTTFNANGISPDLGGMNFLDLGGDLSSDSDNGSAFPITRIPMSHANSTSSRGYPGSPTLDQCPVTPLHLAVVGAEASWPLAKCHPPVISGSCPRTALLHLEYLEQSSQKDESWSATQIVPLPSVKVCHMLERTRDGIVATALGVLHKALSIRRGGNERSKTFSPVSPAVELDYLVLPPSTTLELLLQVYVHGLVMQLESVPGGVLDSNDLTMRSQASTLLVLLMITQGASNINTNEARCLAASLTEICRIFLFDLIEKDVETSAEPTILHCALLLVNLGAWSGDKWHMDIVMGQRGMYLAMLKHSGALEPQQSTFPAEAMFQTPESQWRAWIYLEEFNRLVYKWALTDLETSIFYDAPPVLQVTDFHSRLPNFDELWVAPTHEKWTAIVTSIYPARDDAIMMEELPPTLFRLFSDFLQHTIPETHMPCMMRLRLLLHPLQSMTYQICQTLSCFSKPQISYGKDMKAITQESAQLRLGEIQGLLGRWYDMFTWNVQSCGYSSFAQSSLVLYHLLSLSTFTSFPEIERLARKENCDSSRWETSLRYKRCIQHSTEAVYHAGRVIKILKSIPTHDRCPWWPVAIYRAALVLWVDCLSKIDSSLPHQSFPVSIVAIDDAEAEDQNLCAWRCKGIGVPVLLASNGRMTKLEKPADVLSHCISFVEIPSTARTAGGIRRKLERLLNVWHVQV